MAADENQEISQPPKEHSILAYLPILTKVIEIILGVFAIGLIVDPFNSFHQVFNRPRVKLDDMAFIYITLGGYLVINALFVITHLLGNRIPKRTLILFASVGALFHVITGGLIIHDWRKSSSPYYHITNNELYPSKQYLDMLISAAVFALFNGVVFVLDALVTIRYA